MRPAAALPVAVALVTFAAESAAVGSIHAQVVKGRVVVAGTEEPIRDVLVRLRFLDGRQATSAVTDTSGSFRLHAPRLGVFTLDAERVGMASVSTGSLRINVSEEVEVLLQLGEAAVPHEPLVVNARSAIEIGLLAGYYERIERQQLLGAGHIITRDQIAERQPLDVADLLRDVPSIAVTEGANRAASILFRSSRGQCIPKVYINGVRQNRGGPYGTAAVVDEAVRPNELEGIEVYRGISEMPADFYDEGHCGVILLWTRRDAEGGRPLSWRRFVVGLAAAAAMVLVLMR